MSDVARRKTIFIEYKFTNGSPATGEVNLSNINFDSDDIYVKNVVYYYDGTEVESAILHFSLLGGAVCRVIDTYHSTHGSDIIYQVDGLRVDGLYTLTLKDALTGIVETDRQGKLTFTLEFVLYKK